MRMTCCINTTSASRQMKFIRPLSSSAVLEVPHFCRHACGYQGRQVTQSGPHLHLQQVVMVEVQHPGAAIKQHACFCVGGIRRCRSLRQEWHAKLRRWCRASILRQGW